MMQLRYHLHGELVEEHTTCSVMLPISNLNRKLLEENFPYQGTFHYRIIQRSTTSGHGGGGYCWLDVVNENDSISPDESTSIVEVQALAIKLERNENINNNLEYYEAVIKQVATLDMSGNSSGYHDEQNRATIGKTAPGAMNVIAKGATNVWNIVVNTATALQQSLTSTPLTDEAEEKLSNLSDKLGSSNESDPEHVAILANVWSVLFPSVSFERPSNKWKEAGFQGVDPVKDLKQSGTLALECIVYMGSKYSSRTQLMLNAQKANSASNYPFAIVGINITLLLATIISLKDQRYLSASANYWAFFENPVAFHEAFSACFFHLDHIWNQRKSTRADFSRIIGEVKLLITNVLNRAPKSIEEFKYICQEESMIL